MTPDFLLEQRGFGHLEADVETDADQDGREQERDAPAPGQEHLAGQQGDDRQHDGRQDGTGWGTHVGEAGGESPLALVGVLQRHQCGAAPLATDRESLDQSQQDQQDRRECADGVVGGKQADGKAGHAHQGHGEHQHRLAADAVTEVPEHHPAQWSDDVADGQGAEGGNRRDHRTQVGEEQLPEHECGCGAVEQEVVELDGAAQKAGEQHSAHLGRIPHLFWFVRLSLGDCSGVGHGHSLVLVATVGATGLVRRAGATLVRLELCGKRNTTCGRCTTIDQSALAVKDLFGN